MLVLVNQVASAGLNQGQLLGSIKLAQNFSNGQRDILYKNAINVTVSFPGFKRPWLGSSLKTQHPLNCWDNLRAS